MSTSELKPNVADALKEWRLAEQDAAVAKLGRDVARLAAAAAAAAAEAALATADAARASLVAAGRAEASALRTAETARLVALATAGESENAAIESELADSQESMASEQYHDAVHRAANNGSLSPAETPLATRGTHQVHEPG